MRFFLQQEKVYTNRASRLEFLGAMLLSILVFFAYVLIQKWLQESGYDPKSIGARVLQSAVFFFCAMIFIEAVAYRLRDIGYSAWWGILLIVFPALGFLFLFGVKTAFSLAFWQDYRPILLSICAFISSLPILFLLFKRGKMHARQNMEINFHTDEVSAGNTLPHNINIHITISK